MEDTNIIAAIDRSAERIAQAIENSGNAQLMALQNIEGLLNALHLEALNTAKALESLVEQNRAKEHDDEKGGDAS